MNKNDGMFTVKLLSVSQTINNYKEL